VSVFGGALLSGSCIVSHIPLILTCEEIFEINSVIVSRLLSLVSIHSVLIRAVSEFGSGRNPAFSTNPADIRLGQNWARFQILPDLENFH